MAIRSLKTHERWTENYTTMRDHVLCAIPYPVRFIMGFLIYWNAVKTLHGQGTGQFSTDEIMWFRREVWENVEALRVAAKRKRLADGDDDGRPFGIFGGEGPAEADATVFGFTVSMFICTV